MKVAWKSAPRAILLVQDGSFDTYFYKSLPIVHL